jgi:GT2 family glycosyltransferase
VLLNNDTHVRAGWLAALVKRAESEPTAGAVTSKLVFADRPGLVQNAGSLLLDDGSGADRGFEEEDKGQYDRAEEVFGFCGAAALLRRQALADVGLFDEDFFMYYEDLDLSWRLRLRGWKVIYEPAAVVDHVHAGSSGHGSPLMRFHADRNRLFTVLKNASPAFVWRSFSSLGRRATHRSSGGALERSRRRVLASFAVHLPAMLARRARVRSRRTVPDSEILRWLYPRERWDTRS